MQDRPTADELLDALAEYLYAELRPHVPPEQRFKTLVAANVCAVIAREIRDGECASQADLRTFTGLLGARESTEDPRDAARALSTSIRAGELDPDLERVAAELREHVRRKLEIARPGYARD